MMVAIIIANYDINSIDVSNDKGKVQYESLLMIKDSSKRLLSTSCFPKNALINTILVFLINILLIIGFLSNVKSLH